MAEYTNKSQQNLIKIFQTLAEGFRELSAKEIAKETGMANDAAFRALQNLLSAGWVEKYKGQYRLSQYWPKIGRAFGEHLAVERCRANERLQEFIG